MSYVTKSCARRIAIALTVMFCATPLHQTLRAASTATDNITQIEDQSGASWMGRYARWTYHATVKATKNTGIALKKGSINILKGVTKFSLSHLSTEASRYMLHAALRTTPYAFSPDEIVLINSSDRHEIEHLSPQERRKRAQKAKTVIVFIVTQCVNAGTLYALEQVPALSSDCPEYFVYPFLASHIANTILPCSAEGKSVWRGAYGASENTTKRAATIGYHLLRSVQVAAIFAPEITKIIQEKAITSKTVQDMISKGVVISTLMIGIPYLLSKLITYIDDLDDEDMALEKLFAELEQLRNEQAAAHEEHPSITERAELTGLDHCTNTVTPH